MIRHETTTSPRLSREERHKQEQQTIRKQRLIGGVVLGTVAAGAIAGGIAHNHHTATPEREIVSSWSESALLQEGDTINGVATELTDQITQLYGIDASEITDTVPVATSAAEAYRLTIGGQEHAGNVVTLTIDKDTGGDYTTSIDITDPDEQDAN